MSRRAKPQRNLPSVRNLEAKVDWTGMAKCHWCQVHIDASKTFCGSPECTHQWKVRSDNNYARESVLRRDMGVCKSCGLDTEKLRQLLYKVKTERGDTVYMQLINAYQRKTGYSFAIGKHFWEMDHIIPVRQGGGSCGLENLQTLCWPCHKRKSTRENKRRRRGQVGKSWGLA